MKILLLMTNCLKIGFILIVISLVYWIFNKIITKCANIIEQKSIIDNGINKKNFEKLDGLNIVFHCITFFYLAMMVLGVLALLYNYTLFLFSL